ncbi:MAG: DoxX family protein [Novosphingobium sp.]
MSDIAALIGRILIAVLFIHSGIGKLIDPAQTAQMLTGAGLSPGLAVPTGVFELVAGLALVFGFMTRLFAVLLAGFTLLAILFFHREFTDPMQLLMAEKDLAIAGGLLCLFAARQMSWGYDLMQARRRGEIASHDAELRAHDAELRAARAEGRTVAGGEPVMVRKRRWFWQ